MKVMDSSNASEFTRRVCRSGINYIILDLQTKTHKYKGAFLVCAASFGLLTVKVLKMLSRLC